MFNENKNQDKSQSAFAPHDNFAHWDKNVDSNRPGLRRKSKKSARFSKKGKNRIDIDDNFSTEERLQQSNFPTQYGKDSSDDYHPGSWNKNPATMGKDQSLSEWHTSHEVQGELFTDDQLTQDIEAAIQKEDSIADDDKTDVQVFVEDGVVTLTGTVFSDQQKRTIGDKAVAFAGIGKVHNLIDVREDILLD